MLFSNSVSCALSFARTVDKLWAQHTRCFVQQALKSADEGLPTVAIIGRPNVGKSAMFNRLTQRATALVWDTSGSHVTRDYKEGVAQLSDLRFNVIDTSGLEPFMSQTSIQGRATRITSEVLRRVDAAMLLVDARTGVAPQDSDMARWVRQHVAAPVLVIATKCDNLSNTAHLSNAFEASALGLGEAIPYSAETRAGTSDLYDALRPIVDRTSTRNAAAGGEHGAASAPAAPIPSGQHRAAVPGAAEGGPGARRPSSTGARTQAAKRPVFGGWDLTQPARAPDSTPLRHAPGTRDAESTTAGGAPSGAARPVTAGASGQADGETGVGTSAAQGRAVESPVASVGEREAGVLGVDRPIKLVILGLPNSGKSTLLNTLLGYERVLTGSEPGLTRDAVSAPFTWRGVRFELTDTAGWMRDRRLSMFDDVGGKVAALTVRQGAAKLSFSHAALLLIDAAEAASRLAARRAAAPTLVMMRTEIDLALSALDEGRILIIGANKADLLTSDQRLAVLNALDAQLETSLASHRDCILTFPISGRTGRGINTVLQRVRDLGEKWSTRISTSRLNAWRYKMALGMVGHGSHPLTLVKYLKMVSTRPPTFLAEFKGKVVQPTVPVTVARAIRSAFGLEGVPVRVVPMTKIRREERRQRRGANGAFGARRRKRRTPALAA